MELVELIRTIFQLLDRIVMLYSFTLIIYALMSWFPDIRHSRVYEFFYNVTHPYLSLFRFARVGMMDLSVMVGYFALVILRSIILPVMQSIIIDLVL